MMKTLLRLSINVLPLKWRSKIKDIPIIASLQRWAIRRWMTDGSFVHVISAGPAAGLVFEISLPQDKGVWIGNYEIDFANSIRDAVKPESICFDVGGYRGYIAGLMAVSGADQVIIFEPLPENRASIERLRTLNPHLALEVIPAAAGSFDGMADFKIMSDPSMGKLSLSHFQEEIPPRSTIEVAVSRLDTLVGSSHLPPPSLIKIDVEGAELDVLEGARDVLRMHHPILFIEAHSRDLEDGCRRLLGEYGYMISRIEKKVPGSDQTRHLIAEATQHDYSLN